MYTRPYSLKGKKPIVLSQFEWLKTQITEASKEGRQIYIFGVSMEDHFSNLSKTLRELRNLPHIFDAGQVEGTIECIATGSKENMNGLVREIYITTLGDKVGWVKWDEKDRDHMEEHYDKIRKAIKIAWRTGKQHCFYNPEEDYSDLLTSVEPSSFS